MSPEGFVQSSLRIKQAPAAVIGWCLRAHASRQHARDLDPGQVEKLSTTYLRPPFQVNLEETKTALLLGSREFRSRRRPHHVHPGDLCFRRLALAMFGLEHAGKAILLATGTTLLYIAARILYNIFLHPLRHYPGPLLWRATRLTWVIALQRGYLHLDLLALHDKYGPIVRVAPDELSYIDARAWKDIYLTGGARSGHAAIERNAVWFMKQKATEPWSIMGNDENAHARYRRAFMSAFSEKAVKEQAPLIEKYVDMMMRQFQGMAASGGGSAVVDMASWLNFVTFDISADLSFGESFGSTESGKPHPWVEISCRFGKGVALMASTNHFAPLQKVMAYMTPAKVREKMKYHRELSVQKVRQRLQVEEERPDFVQAVIRYNQEKVEKVTTEELEMNMSIFVFAGSETSSTALASVIFGLLNTPAAMGKVTEEIRSAFAREKDIDVASVSKLEYLTAVINEGMRLGPPSALTVPRVVPPSGEEICGKWVPGGVSVSSLHCSASGLTTQSPDSCDSEPIPIIPLNREFQQPQPLLS